METVNKLVEDKKIQHTNAFMTLSELMAQQFPDAMWVIEDLVPEGLTVMSAKPASYKTWFLLKIATCVAGGTDLLERFETTKMGVLMVDEENNIRLLQQRLEYLKADPELPINFMVERNFKLETKQIDYLIRYCKESSIGLITFDSLVRIHNANENDAVEMAAVFAKMREFTKAGISVLVTHHHRKTAKGKESPQDMRGSSDILAAVDCHLVLDRKARLLTLTQNKLRLQEEMQPVEFEVKSSVTQVEFEYLGLLEHPKTRQQRLQELIVNLLTDGKQINQKVIGGLLAESDNGANMRTIRKALGELVNAGRVATSSGSRNEILYQISGES